MIDAIRGVETPLTFTPDDMRPVWSPDGARVVFASARETPPNLYVKTISSGVEEQLFASTAQNYPTSWSADGRVVIYETVDVKSGWDVWMLMLDGRQRKPLLQSSFNEREGRLSPDGRWIAYSSTESGREEVYVRPFPALSAKTAISTDGGNSPVWRDDGTELFYVAPDSTIMAVSISSGSDDELKTSLPVGLFKVPFGGDQRSEYAVSRDGRRFLVNKVAGGSTPTPITVMINWPAAFKKSGRIGNDPGEY